MPESRDRLIRPENDIATLFARRRQAVRETGVLPDDERIEMTTPRRTITRAHAATRRPVRGSGLTRGSSGFRRGGRFGPPRIGQENMPISLAGTAASVRRGRSSVLPSWYPRTPFRDVTDAVRAIERRQLATPDATEQQPLTDAQLEHVSSMITPAPVAKAKVFTPHPVLKIFVDETNQIEKSEFITPQKKLLNSLDIVGKVMMEELIKQKSTPTAKKAEREKRVRTLMSMR